VEALEIAKSLFALTHRGINYSLERITAATVYNGNAELSYPSIHVAGTNGKGSTCSYIESVFRTAGFTTGLFTSPHIISFEERFRINGEPISSGELVSVYEKVRGSIEKFGLTFFEATMVIAIELFRQHNVGWAVFETGMGGRLDATNILRPAVTAITSISMDHCDYLGTTLEEIALEKLGIIKDNTPAVVAQPTNEKIRTLIDTVCRQKNAPLIVVSQDTAQCIEECAEGTFFKYNENKFHLRMPGLFQIQNALIAAETVRAATKTVALHIIAKGISLVNMPARFQKVAVGKKTVILDVAHNPDAIRTLCINLKKHFHEVPLCIVTGIMADKNYRDMMEQLSKLSQHVIASEPAIARSAKAEDLVKHLPDSGWTIRKKVSDAVREALSSDEAVICITGSFYTVNEAVIELENIFPENKPLIT